MRGMVIGALAAGISAGMADDEPTIDVIKGGFAGTVTGAGVLLWVLKVAAMALSTVLLVVRLPTKNGGVAAAALYRGITYYEN